jgi:uncharacterized protein (TIGR00266 family)
LNVDILGNPDFGHLKFLLDSGDSVLVESGAMSAMDDHIDVKVEMLGGLLPALGRKLFTGESLLVGRYTAGSAGQRLSVSPSIPGQVMHRKCEAQRWILTPGSFMACTDGVKLSTIFGGLKAIFSGEGMFFIEVTGTGDLWYNAYGAIVEKSLEGDELIVDTGHVVAWEPSLSWSIQGMGNLMSTFFSGEGLVMKFSGTGRIWLQSRSIGGLTGWLRGYC